MRHLMTSRPRLKTRLLLSFLVTGIISIGITGWQAYDRAREALEEETFNRLTAVREARRRQLEYYMDKLKTDVISYSNDQLIANATLHLLHSSRACRVNPTDSSRSLPGLRYSILSDRSTPPAGCNSYAAYYRKFRPLVSEYVALHGYENVMIVDAQSGTVVFSLGLGEDFGSDLLHGLFSNTNAAEAFRLVRDSTDRNAYRFVDFQFYRPIAGTAAFAASPIVIDNRTEAVLLLQVSTRGINTLMTENNAWEENGLGHSGETYIVGSDHRMRNDSRFFIQEPHKYFDLLRDIGTSASTIAGIRENRSCILLQEVHTDAVRKALEGETATKRVDDYRGVPVLSSFTPLQIQGADWVLLSEIDEGEAFRAVYRLREHLILVGFFILLMTVIVGYITSRVIARPILALADATSRFGSGEMQHRAVVGTDDEIGLLARAFNTMADRIMRDTESLRSEIEERQRAEEEVHVSREQFRSLSIHLQTVREEERSNIAREIHDELGQNLAVLKLDLSLLKLDSPNESMKKRISGMELHIDTTIGSVKRIISELRPGILDDLGLAAAIEWLTQEFQSRTGIRCCLTIDPPDIVADSGRSTTVFRILQETLTNVLRHSGASKVNIQLDSRSDALSLSVADNGRGITPEEIEHPKSFGLVGIRERAYIWGGTVSIEGSPENGTRVCIHIPFIEGSLHHDTSSAG